MGLSQHMRDVVQWLLSKLGRIPYMERISWISYALTEAHHKAAITSQNLRF